MLFKFNLSLNIIFYAWHPSTYSGLQGSSRLQLSPQPHSPRVWLPSPQIDSRDTGISTRGMKYLENGSALCGCGWVSMLSGSGRLSRHNSRTPTEVSDFKKAAAAFTAAVPGGLASNLTPCQIQGNRDEKAIPSLTYVDLF